MGDHKKFTLLSNTRTYMRPRHMGNGIYSTIGLIKLKDSDGNIGWYELEGKRVSSKSVQTPIFDKAIDQIQLGEDYSAFGTLKRINTNDPKEYWDNLINPSTPKKKGLRGILGGILNRK